MMNATATVVLAAVVVPAGVVANDTRTVRKVNKGVWTAIHTIGCAAVYGTPDRVKKARHAAVYAWSELDIRIPRPDSDDPKVWGHVANVLRDIANIIDADARARRIPLG